MSRLAAVALALLVLAGGSPSAAGGSAAAATDHGSGAGPGPVPPAAPLPAPPGRTSLLSQTRDGDFPDNASTEPSMSADGRYVAFSSLASDIAGNDEPASLDVFLLDRRTGRTVRAALPNGLPRRAGASSSQPSISADGRFVAYTYQTPPPDGSTDGEVQIRAVVVWNVAADNAVFVTTGARPILVPGYEPSISGDGRYVAFTTANDLPGDKDGGQLDVARWDRRSGDLVLVSVGALDGHASGGSSQTPSISNDGNLVAFASDGGDTILPISTGPGAQVYVRNIATGRTRQVSRGLDDRPPRDTSQDPAISGDGRYVAFTSAASNLTSEGTGGLFRRDLRTNTTTMVSVAPDGSAGNGFSGQPALSTDGRFIAFASLATNLVPETLGRIAPAATSRIVAETFLRDMTAGETILISVSLDNGPSGARSFQPAVGGAGRFVAFSSNSDQLVLKDGNETYDIFLRDLPPVPVINPGSLDLGSRAVGTESLPLAATLGNAGWTPLRVSGAAISGPQRGDFRIVADGCRGITLERNQACTVTVVFRPTARGTRTAVLEVSDAFQGSPRTVRLRGAASQVKVELDPPLGMPGIVTVATGSGFPANTPVLLTWSEGITPRLGPITTDARGRFRVQVLVFHNDITGSRELQVAPADGSAFAPVAATMLVTKPPVVPPRFDIQRLIDVPLVLVIRG